MLLGYARVSTHDQTLYLQTDALKAAGCDPDHIYTDTITGVKADRPGLREAQSHLKAGDTLVVWRLDRLGRTRKQFIELINDLNARDIGFKSLTESIDTTTSGGKLVFHIFGALAGFERELIRERTRAGLEAARARGKKGGRPKITATDPKKIERARKLYHDTGMSPKEICETLQISKTPLYRYVAK